jgi:hypothetical protein
MTVGVKVRAALQHFLQGEEYKGTGWFEANMLECEIRNPTQ